MRSSALGRTPALALALALFGCSQPQPAQPPGAATQPATARGATPDTRDAVDPDGVVRRGEALSGAEAITVAQALASAEGLAGKTVKLTGPVGTVCAKKGCWFALKGEDGQNIRITAKGYGFFVPKDAVGLTATVEGELEVKTLDVATAQHFEDDAAEATGAAARKVEAPVREVSVVAAGLEMKKIDG